MCREQRYRIFIQFLHNLFLSTRSWALSGDALLRAGTAAPALRGRRGVDVRGLSGQLAPFGPRPFFWPHFYTPAGLLQRGGLGSDGLP